MGLPIWGSTPFPALEPIPLPAPVWLFKVLHDLTLSLHFVALFLFLGGLFAAILLNWRGHRSASPQQIEASNQIAGWLPVIMTYVINLGVPPLLFAQVLYGRALYTSSVLIGAYWIAVIPLLIFCYHLLYVLKARGANGLPWYGQGIASLLTAWIIARIYTMNMTLMIAPEVWRDAYRTSASGVTILDGPAAWPRWMYMLASGFIGSGVLLMWLGQRKSLGTETRATLQRNSVGMCLGGTLVSVAMGIMAWWNQSAVVQEACSSKDVLWMVAVAVWGIGSCLVMATASMSRTEGSTQWKMPAVLSLGAFLQIAGYVVCRDWVRDATLASHGFDVWARSTVINYSVLILFFGLFVAGLGVCGWLGWSAYQAQPLTSATSKEENV